MKNFDWSAMLIVALVGCSSQDTLGFKTGTVSGTTPPRTSAAQSCTLPDAPHPVGNAGGTSGVPDPGLVGTWHGTVNNHMVELVIDSGAPTGVIAFGEDEPPPPPTNGELGYPLDFGSDFGFGGSAQILDDGFRYTMFDGSVVDDIVSFGVASSELWQDWCPLQTSYDSGSGTCGCVPNWGGTFDPGSNHCSQPDPGTEQDVTRDCRKLGLCISPDWGPCACTASGCFAKMERTLQFTLTRDEDVLEGTLEGGSVNGWFESYPVLVTRQ